MKASKTGRGAVAYLAIGLAMVLAFAACDDDKVVDNEEGSAVIRVAEILVSPKAPAPGDTAMLTAVVTSSDNISGDFASYAWSASGGQFLETNKQTVRWVAPLNSGILSVSVNASNEATPNTSSSTNLFVGLTERLVSANAGQIFLLPNGTDFLYFRTLATTNLLSVWQYVGGTASDPVVGGPAGSNLAMSPDLTGWSYQTQTTFNRATNAIELYLDSYAGGTANRIAYDDVNVLPDDPRLHQYTRPKFSPDSNLLVFQALRPNRQQGAIDSVDVDVYNRTTQQTVTVTQTHGGFRKNFAPSVSSDGNWLLFISDRAASNSWEYYGLPIVAGVVATDSAQTVQMTDTGGGIAGGSATAFDAPRAVWNPNPATPVLAVACEDGVLRLIAPGTPANVIEVSGVVDVAEMVWSNDGSMLAVSDNTSIYTVGVSQASAALAVQAQLGDVVRDITWSPDNEWLIYRVGRSGSAWFEILDLDAGLYEDPISITASFPRGEVGAYRTRMSTASVMNSAGEMYMLIFDGATPSVWKLDVSGVLQ